MSVSASDHELRDDPLLQGALIMTVYGSAWALVADSGLVGVGPHQLGLVLAVVLSLAVGAAVGRASLLLRRQGLAAGGNRVRHGSPNARQGFARVNAGQGIAIFVSAVVLGRAGVPNLIGPAICLVVGLHFFFLARLFDQPQYWWTGALLVLAAAAGAIVPAGGLGGAAVREVVGFSAALVLWGTAAHLATHG